MGQFNIDYVKSLPGIVKISCVVLLILSAAMVMNQARFEMLKSALMLVVINWLLIVYTLVLFMLYTLNVIQGMQNVPWAVVELIVDAIATLLIFIASLLVAIEKFIPTILIVGAVLGIFAAIAFGVDAFLKFKEWRRK